MCIIKYVNINIYYLYIIKCINVLDTSFRFSKSDKKYRKRVLLSSKYII